MTTRLPVLLLALSVAVVASCAGEDAVTSTSHAEEPEVVADSPDGSLDCDNETTFTQQGIVLPDTRGESTPERALRGFLEQWIPRFRGEIAIVREKVGSLVVGGRERVVAKATSAPAGGWIVLTTHYCEGYGL